MSSGLDLLPTFVNLAGGTLDEGIEYDGFDLSPAIVDTNPKPDDEPTGTFVYWCGVRIHAVRIDRYKVIYFSQLFTGSLFNYPEDGEDNQGEFIPTPEFMCAGTGTSFLVLFISHGQ